MSAVRATGVRLRPATDREQEAFALTRRGREHTLVNILFEVRSRLHRRPEDETLVIGEAFVEFVDERGEEQRWEATERRGHAVPLEQDATMELLDLAGDAAMGLVQLLADVRIGGPRVTRWEFVSAPHRVELDPALAARLSPMR